MKTEFTAGDVLSQTSSVYLKNIVPFTLISILVFLPIILYSMVFFNNPNITEEDAITYAIIVGLSGMILPIVATTTITYGVVQELRGNHVSMGQCITAGLSRLLPTLGTVFLYSLTWDL